MEKQSAIRQKRNVQIIITNSDGVKSILDEFKSNQEDCFAKLINLMKKIRSENLKKKIISRQIIILHEKNLILKKARL